MGRTVPSYRRALETEINRWNRFRKGLRDKDAATFDRLMNACRRYASAGSLATRPLLLDVMFMSILLHHETTITELRAKIGRLTKQRDTRAHG